jgi:hypothetical protein
LSVHALAVGVEHAHSRTSFRLCVPEFRTGKAS